jgi:hypothetical protein
MLKSLKGILSRKASSHAHPINFFIYLAREKLLKKPLPVDTKNPPYLLEHSLLFSFMYISCVCSVTKQQKREKS